ncbi:MAG: minor capsid protein [Lachnospiraceae bacterium]|nr:minor capsid protein [Lachnospiraceae bacterium]
MKVKIKIDSANAILAKRKLGKGGGAQRFLVHEVRRVTDPYVPKLNGDLKDTAIENDDSIEYVQPYAEKQYNQNKGNGLRGKEWDKRSWADHGKEITESVAKFIGGKAK